MKILTLIVAKIAFSLVVMGFSNHHCLGVEISASKNQNFSRTKGFQRIWSVFSNHLCIQGHTKVEIVQFGVSWGLQWLKTTALMSLCSSV